MAASGWTYGVDQDLREDRRDYLQFVLGVSTLIVVFLYIIESRLLSSLPSFGQYLPWLTVGASLLGSYLCLRWQRPQTAARVFSYGLSASLLMQVILRGVTTESLFWLLMPIVLSYFLLDDLEVPFMAGLQTTLLLIIGIWQMGFAAAVSMLLIHVILCVSIAAIGVLYTQAMVQRVVGALDAQQKGTVRAEHFYEQSEQLKAALLEVQKYSSLLWQANADLAGARKAAETASQAKSVFLSNMSHELRTPLNVIIGYAESMVKMPQMFNGVALAEVHRPVVQQIEENGRYLLTLINDILDLGKIEAGKVELNLAAVTLGEIARGVTVTAIGLVKAKPVQIHADVPEDLPPVWADEVRLRQVLLNLLSNAVKFTETGSVTLQARREGDRVRVSVTDTGIGIPAHMLSSIFDRFQQAGRETERKYGGTGLGLDISKQLVALHGGDLTATSVEGHGSTFTFTLPTAPAAEVSTQTRRPFDGAVVFEKGIEPQATPTLILLAVTDGSLRKLWHEALESAGYGVIATHSGRDVIAIAEAIPPGLIVLDAELRDMAWGDVVARLRSDELTAAVPLVVALGADIVVTGEGNMSLHKSASKKLLRQTVAQALGGHLMMAGDF